jgi:outer membrane protein assembly factor BamB
MFFKTSRFLPILVLALPSACLHAENWPQWRGEQGTGISNEKFIATEWGGQEGALWRLELPGPAGSTPAIWGDQIYLTSADNDDLVLIAASTDGKLIWKEKVSTGNVKVRGDEGNWASPSPSTDGKHVWAMFGNGVLTCRDTDGKEIWTMDLQEKYGKFNIQFGMTSTPVLDKGRLYVMCMYTGNSYIVALDAATGKEIWKHVRKSDAVEECEHSYASPVIYRDSKHEFLLAHGADYVTAHQLSDGAEIFRCGGLNGAGQKYNPTLRFVASPATGDGIIVVPSAKKGPVIALSPEAKGNVTNSEEGHLWRMPRNTPDVPSPLIVEGLVYLCGEDGVLTCVDAKTGEQYYSERVHTGRHRASPVFADGRIYMVSRSGVISVVKAGKKYELLAKNDLAEEISASPAISNGKLFIRSFDALYAFGKK